jgi:hypothetical protein
VRFGESASLAEPVNLTFRPAAPDVLSALTSAIGEKPSSAFSIRYSAECSSPWNQEMP